ELVLRLSEDRALLFAHADHAEMYAADLDQFVERITFAEQFVGDGPAEHHDRMIAIDLRRADQAASFVGIEGREVEIVPRDPLDLDAVERLLAPLDARARA